MKLNPMDENSEEAGLRKRDGHGLEVTRDAFLGGRLMLYQPKKGHRAGVDAVLLAASVGAAKKGGQHIIDVGAGPGTVGFLIAKRIEEAKVTCVEIEQELVELGLQNRDDNDLMGRVDIINADIFSPSDVLERAGLRPGQFDHVVSNPPYYSDAAARLSQNHLKRRANSMAPLGLERWIKFMTSMVRNDGCLSLVHLAERLDELLKLLSGRFGALQIFPIYPRAGKAAIRVIIRGRKGSRAPLRLHSGIVLHEGDGSYTPEALSVLRSGAALDLAGL